MNFGGNPGSSQALSLEVRPYDSHDRAAVRQIAYQTAFLGDSIAPLMPDPELFADLWTAVYTDLHPDLALVATLNQKTVGYIFGVTDSRSLPADYFRHVLPLVLTRLVRGEYPNWRPALAYLFRAALEPSTHAPYRLYPAHLHINLLEVARGHGAGRALLEGFLAQCQAKGALGVQLSTTDHNTAAVRLYERNGFTVYNSSLMRLYSASVSGPMRRLVMVRVLERQKA